jgi:hypothetical protein
MKLLPSNETAVDVYHFCIMKTFRDRLVTTLDAEENDGERHDATANSMEHSSSDSDSVRKVHYDNTI